MAFGDRTDAGSHAMADLFVGMMVAVLLILVALWLQTLADVYEIRKLKKLQKIFDDAFASVIDEGDPDIEIDPKKGEITLKADHLFPSGRYRFLPDQDSRKSFVRIRGHIAEILDEIDKGFEQSDVVDGATAAEHVDVVVIGHTDCIPLGKHVLRDNWDLSTVRAVSLANFLTEECDAPGTSVCCADGSLDCAPGEVSRRVPSTWRVIPAGRGELDPRPVDGVLDKGLWSKPCTKAEVPESIRQYQRRVVIQIVPRMDKFIVRSMASEGP